MTQVVNDLVNGAGMTFWPRLAGETGATAAELTRANFVAREIFGSLQLREELKALDNVLDARVQTRMRLEMRTLVERASRWLVTNRRPPLDSQGTVDFFSQPVQRVMAQLPELMTGRELTAFLERRDGLVEQGVAEDLATRVAGPEPGVHAARHRRDRRPRGPRPGGGRPAALRARRAARAAAAGAADPGAAARGPLADDGPRRRCATTCTPCTPSSPPRCSLSTSPDDPAPARIAAWEDDDSVVVSRAVATLEEICADE